MFAVVLTGDVHNIDPTRCLDEAVSVEAVSVFKRTSDLCLLDIGSVGGRGDTPMVCTPRTPRSESVS